MNEKFCILINISLNFFPKGPIDNNPALVQCWPDSLWSTRGRWVKLKKLNCLFHSVQTRTDCLCVCFISDNWWPSSGTSKRHCPTYEGYVLCNTVKCHYNACHYNANASLTRSILGSQTAPTSWHALMNDRPRVAQHMGKRCEIIAVWSATAAMTPLCSHTNGTKQTYPTCWSCQYSRFMIDLRSNTLIIHLRCSENATIRPIWLLDARMLKTIPVAIKLT